MHPQWQGKYEKDETGAVKKVKTVKYKGYKCKETGRVLTREEANTVKCEPFYQDEDALLHLRSEILFFPKNRP